MYWTQLLLGKFRTKKQSWRNCCSSFLLECNFEASWSDDFDMDVLGEMGTSCETLEKSHLRPVRILDQQSVKAWMSYFPFMSPSRCRCQDYFPDEKKFAQVLKETPEMDWAEAVSVSMKLIHYGHGAERISVFCGSRTCTIYVGLERVRSLAAVHFGMKSTAKDHQLFPFPLLRLIPFRAWDRKPQVLQEHVFVVGNRWIMMNLHGIEVTHDWKNAWRPKWTSTSPMRFTRQGSLICLIDVKVLLCYKWRTNT